MQGPEAYTYSIGLRQPCFTMDSYLFKHDLISTQRYTFNVSFKLQKAAHTTTDLFPHVTYSRSIERRFDPSSKVPMLIKPDREYSLSNI